MKLDGFGIFVNDMEVMVDFYKNVLGFEIVHEKGNKNVQLIKDGVLFMFYGRLQLEKMTDNKFNYAKNINGHFEVALSVLNYDSVDNIYNKVISLGAKSVMKPTTEPWGQRTCYISDPEGNLIEIGSFNK